MTSHNMHGSDKAHTPATSEQEHGGMASYFKLAISLALSFVVMYFLTFAMINVLGDLFLNISNLYMALMMVFPMGIIMIGSVSLFWPRSDG
ncbi:hypothetical protein B4U78_014590 [Microbacterium esteraromaticum]|nr:hypothetical protein B4U78_014590 [Microbacterium esteraromaticum]